MQIGSLGAGEVALAFARYALKAGHEILLSNSRGPESLASTVAELGTGAKGRDTSRGLRRTDRVAGGSLD
jgi:predicted dinucleotide-binding enzyme